MWDTEVLPVKSIKIMKKSPLSKILSASLICGLAIPAVGSAATYVRSGTGDWNTLALWNDNGSGSFTASTVLPGDTDTVVINNGRDLLVGNPVINSIGSVIVNNNASGTFTSSLEVNAGGSLTTGAFTISQNLNAADLKVQGGALTTGALNVNDNGTATVTSGTLSSTTVTIKGGGAAGVTPGSMSVSGTGAVTASALTTIQTDVNGPGVLNVSGGTYNGAGFAVQGTMNVSGTGAVTSTGAFTNTGTTNVSGGTLAVGANQVIVNGGNLNVNGGALSVTGGLANFGALKADGGDINLSAGSITVNENSSGGGTTHVTAAGSGKLNVTGGSFIVTGQTVASDTVQFNGEVTISGAGTVFSVAEGQVIASNDAVFNINGAGAIITMDNLNLGNGSRQAEFNFNFDAAGISTVQNPGFMSLGDITLNVDGSLYAGGIDSFDLFASNNLTSLIGDLNINVTGLGDEGVDWELVQVLSTNGGNGNVTLNILSIPEPSAYALTGGLLAMGFVMVRRRR